jgi:type VI protein secretion system component Hcp
VDGFLSIAGVLGTSTDQEFPQSWSVSTLGFSVTNTFDFASGTGAGAGKPVFSPLTVTVDADAASGLPILYQDAASGKALPSVTLHLRRSTGQLLEFATITLTNAVVSNVQTAASAGSTTLQLSFVFEQIDFVFTPIDPTGAGGASIEFAYDISRGVATGGSSGQAVAYAMGPAPSQLGEEAITAFSPPSVTGSPGLQTGLGAGKPSFSGASVVVPNLDKSVLQSLSWVALGTAVPDLRVDLFGGNPTPIVYLSYDFSNVVESTVSVSGLTTLVGWQFEKVKWTSTPIKPDGTAGAATTAGWDVLTNQSF